jgi:hypothetical protein
VRTDLLAERIGQDVLRVTDLEAVALQTAQGTAAGREM